MRFPARCNLPAAALLFVAQAACAQSHRTAAIPDAGGFAEPITAATVEVPADWRTGGAVYWNHATHCVTNKVRFDWQARSRDDLHAVEIMPGYNWQVQGTAIQMNPCPTQPFRSARDFLQAVVQQRRAGARVLQYRDRPDVAAERQAAAQQPPSGAQFRRKAESGQVLIAYQSGGVEFREVLGTTVEFSELRGNVVAGASMVFAHRAPHGKLDFDLADRIERSFRFDRRWGEMMVASLRESGNRYSAAQSQAIAQWHAREMARINAEGAADRAAIRAAGNREVARINAETYAGTLAANDRIHRRNLEGIGEYNTYRTPEGVTVRSSIHGGERVLRGSNGAVFSTDDPYFSPAGSTELKRVR